MQQSFNMPMTPNYWLAVQLGTSESEFSSRAWRLRSRHLTTGFAPSRWTPVKHSSLSSAVVKIYANCQISENLSVMQRCSRCAQVGNLGVTAPYRGTLKSLNSAAGAQDCWLVFPTRATVSRMALKCSCEHSLSYASSTASPLSLWHWVKK